MLWKKILFSLFTFFVVDVTRLRSKEEPTGSLETASIEDQRSEQKKRQTERKKQRLYEKSKWKKRCDYRERTHKYQSTKSRDGRYSNQRSLRRMYRNT